MKKLIKIIIAILLFMTPAATIANVTVQADGTNVEGNDTWRDSPWQYYSHTAFHLQLHHGNQIYYKLKGSSYDRQILQAGINNWNALRVIKLVPTNSSAKAEIIAKISHDPSTDQGTEGNSPETGYTVGNTSNYYNTVNSHYANEFWATSQINSNLYSASKDDLNITGTSRYDFAVNVITHELGHALGFKHNPATLTDPSDGTVYSHIMNAYPPVPSKEIPLSYDEQLALSHYYHLPINYPQSITFD